MKQPASQRLGHTRKSGSGCAIALRRKLLAWYDRHRRDLPWRKTRDPYRIWVSEIMLQQTRVQAVIPYYGKFLRSFPDVTALAGADEQELLAAWSGLGYYSRARNLQKAARAIVTRHGGQFPRGPEEALALAGIGTYTAAAVLSIAYGIPLPVVDGNVARVLSRLFVLLADLRTPTGKQILLEWATVLLSQKHPGDFNQALMELGATVCLPQKPQCPACPLRGDCQAFLRNQVAKYPPSAKKPSPVSRRFTAAVILDGKGNCLLVPRPASARWMKGFWELPLREVDHVDDRNHDPQPLSEDGILLEKLLGRVRHTITTNKLEISVFRARLKRRASSSLGKWVSLGEMDRLPVTTITRKALRLALSK